jgi:hypothetical protein
MIDAPQTTVTVATGQARDCVDPTRGNEDRIGPAGVRPGRRAARRLSSRRHARAWTGRVASATMGRMREPRGTGPPTARAHDGCSATLRIGLLGALTGPLAPVERSIHDAA